MCLKSRMWCGEDAETRWWKGKRLRLGRCWVSPSQSHSERKVSHHSLCVGWKQVFWEQARRCVSVCLWVQGAGGSTGSQVDRQRETGAKKERQTWWRMRAWPWPCKAAQHNIFWATSCCLCAQQINICVAAPHRHNQSVAARMLLHPDGAVTRVLMTRWPAWFKAHA